MKKIILAFVMVMLSALAFGQSNIPAIVVSTFTVRGQALSADDAESVTELFIAELTKTTGKLRVVDRSSLDRVMNEMRFQISDWSNSQKTAQLGAALNAEYMVRGQLNQLGDTISFSLTAQDIKTLELASSSTRSFTTANIFTQGYNGIFYAMPSMSSDIAGTINTKLANAANQRKQETEAAEKARQEQARLAEQDSFTCVGKWEYSTEYGSYSMSSDKPTSGGFYSALTVSNKGGYRLNFYSNGTMDMQINVWNWFDCNRNLKGSLKGTWTRNNNVLQITYSGDFTETVWYRKSTLSGYKKEPDSEVRSFTKGTTLEISIQFLQNGNILKAPFLYRLCGFDHHQQPYIGEEALNKR